MQLFFTDNKVVVVVTDGNLAVVFFFLMMTQNLLNNYDQSGSGSETISRALGSMMSVAQRINDMKRAHERSVRIQEIQSLLYDWNGADPNSYGDLVLEVSWSLSLNNHIHPIVILTLIDSKGWFIFRARSLPRGMGIFGGFQGSKPRKGQFLLLGNPKTVRN